MTGGSASCFSEQYRHLPVLLLYLHQKLDENNSYQQVHMLYNAHVVMKHQTLYFLQNLMIPLLLFANKERSSKERRMEGGIADETSMPPLKCECFGSVA